MDALEMAQYMASVMYTNEFCCVCGCAIIIDAPKASVLKEMGTTQIVRSAHVDCLSKHLPERIFSIDLSIEH